MNLPNKLTMFRVVISFFFLIFLFINAPGAKTIALCLFVAAVITDYYDGKLARELGLTTDFGKLMDPLADKILVSCAFISFVQIHPINISAWMPALIVSRELGITALRMHALSKGKVIPADRRGKEKMASQTTVIIFGLIAVSLKEIFDLLSRPWNIAWDRFISLGMWIFTFLIVIHTIATGLYYFWVNRELLEENIEEKIV